MRNTDSDPSRSCALTKSCQLKAPPVSPQALAQRRPKSLSGGPCMNQFFAAGLADVDPDIAKWTREDRGRQSHQIELIASENIVSRAVMQAQGTVLTNKYAEGYPGKRY